MAVFQWVGGYTGHEGINSGYSGNYAQSGKKVWTSVWNGLTTDRGDFAFAPYHWDFVQNWRERVTSSGALVQFSPYDYIPATRLPRGGDQVVFGAPWVSNAAAADLFTGGRTEVDRRALGISCLFGGCSGASLKWPGASDPASTGDIEFVVTDDFGWNFLAQGAAVVNPENDSEWFKRLIGVGYARHLVGTTPYAFSMLKRLSIGEIGFDSSKITGSANPSNPAQGTYIGADFSLTGFGYVLTINKIAPLHLRFSSFNNRGRRSKARIRQCSANASTSTASIDGWESLVRVMSNNNNSPIAGETANDSTLFVCGQLDTVTQSQGYFGSLDYTGNTNLVVDKVNVSENIYGMHLGNTVQVGTSVVCQPKASFSPINIYCAASVLDTKHDTDQRNGYRGKEDGVNNRPYRMTYRVGSLTGISVALGTWTCESFGPTSTNRFAEPTPRVEMNSFICDNFYGKGGYLKTSDTANQSTYPVFRDGFLKRDTFLDLNKSGDPNFRNSLIGYNPIDEGLRMDSPLARVVFNLGDNVRTNGSGDPNSTT
jgi:hypothetical protein